MSTTLPARPEGTAPSQVVFEHAEALVDLCDVPREYTEMLEYWLELLKFVCDPTYFVCYAMQPKKKGFWDYLAEMNEEVKEKLDDYPPSNLVTELLDAIKTCEEKRKILDADWAEDDYDDFPPDDGNGYMHGY
jgi:hypothetical protein